MGGASDLTTDLNLAKILNLNHMKPYRNVHVIIFIVFGIFPSPNIKSQSINNNIIDNDGNIYNTFSIGNQTWMMENLRVTTYNDGTVLQMIYDNKEWNKLRSPGYSWYNNDSSKGLIYGALYNGFVIKTSNICPIGWHVPSLSEWLRLDTLLNNTCKQNLFPENNTTIDTVQSDSEINVFLNPLAGCRYYDGTFNHLNKIGFWWTSTSENETLLYELNRNRNDSASFGYLPLDIGVSIKCIKD